MDKELRDRIAALVNERQQLLAERAELFRQLDTLRAEIDNLALEIQMLRSSSGEWVLTGSDG